LGLDAEFIENAMLMAVVPDGYLGLDTYYDGDTAVLKVNPSLPGAITNWKLENVRYLGIGFDVFVGNSFAIIQDVNELETGALDKAAIEITLHYTGATPTVTVNGAVVTSGYTVDTAAKTITYVTDFSNLVIAVN